MGGSQIFANRGLREGRGRSVQDRAMSMVRRRSGNAVSLDMWLFLTISIAKVSRYCAGPPPPAVTAWQLGSRLKDGFEGLPFRFREAVLLSIACKGMGRCSIHRIRHVTSERPK